MTVSTGYTVYLMGNGPLSGLPLCWFAYEGDALEFVNNHGSPTYRLEIKKEGE